MEITLKEHCRRIAAAGGRARSEKKTMANRELARRPRPKSRERNKLKRAEKTLKKS